MAEGPSYDFPVVSDEGVDADVALEGAETGRRVLRDEIVYEATGSRFEKGAEIGTLHLEQVSTTKPGKKLFTAIFVFDDGDLLRLEGVVPGNGTWQGKGRAAYVGGTGKFADRRGDVPVDSENPKRWG